MSSENEDLVLLESESQKKSIITYTREFLLSLSELDVCKKLPNGINESILSEFGDSVSANYDRQRNIGNLRGEYAHVSQNRSENSRNQSRWETRSTGSSDKDGDSQSDRDSVSQDSGRRFGNHTRRWQNSQNSEHDGLLGSGVFPRPAGHTVSSVLKSRGNGSYQLNRTTEPYQPPRPYKAAPYPRKDHTDSFNDETFGCAECSSEDRAEEEKKRRASFELMRKEQQKALQEKHSQSHDIRKENLDSDIVALLGNPIDEKPHMESSTSSHIHAPASRPLVPPGFKTALVEKNLSAQSSSAPLSVAGGAAFENNNTIFGTENKHTKGNISADFLPINMEKITPRISSQIPIVANEKLKAPLSTEVLKQKVDFQNKSGKAIVQEATELWEDDIVIMNDSSCKKEPIPETKNAASQDHSSTILEKLFSSALSKNIASLPSNIEHQGVKTDEEKSDHAIFGSSKLSYWFSEEEKKPEEDFSSRELLSLIVNNEKATEDIPLNMTFNNFLTPLELPTPADSGVHEQYSQSDSKIKNKNLSSSVLTCEDLEQSILAEVKETNPNLHHFDAKSEKKVEIDDSASHHLLSLLQKGTILQDSVSSPKQDTAEPFNKLSKSHVNPSFDTTTNNALEQTLTLEALFGASFMNALHSAEAPVSAQRGSTVVTNKGTGEGQSLEFQLPEEDSLIAVNDSLNSTENAPNKYEFLPENNNIEDYNTKFLNAILRDGACAPDGTTKMQKGPLEMVDPNDIYHHLHNRPISQLPHQMDQTQPRPMYPPFDHFANRIPHMKFTGPGGMHHDPHLPFLGNHVRQRHAPSNIGGPRFDPVASQHPMLQQRIPVPEDFSPHHPMHGFPRGAPTMPGYVPEMNNVHNFPMHHPLSNYGGHGMPIPGHGAGVGGSHPEALERLFEMEMRAKINSKQQIHHHPHMPSHNHGIHLPENLNVRYR